MTPDPRLSSPQHFSTPVCSQSCDSFGRQQMVLSDAENTDRFGTVVIVGSGLMGVGIAQCSVEFGYSTIIVSRSAEKAKIAAQKVSDYIRKCANKRFPENEKMRNEWANERLNKFEANDKLEESAAKADLFVESIAEERILKQNLFSKVEPLVKKGTVLVTNTSSIRIADVGSKLKNPQFLGGLHFFSPVPVMGLVEVVRAEKTADFVVKKLEQFGKSIGKVAITCKDSPGFVVNRFVIPMLNTACALIDEGVASVEDIDKASKIGMGLPMGVITLTDFIGVDVVRNAMMELQEHYPDVMRLKPIPVLDGLVKEGRLGRKSGYGFFDYSKTKAKSG